MPHKPDLPDPRTLFASHFGVGASGELSVPGRVNLIGEHIDYHNLPVLPMAIQRQIRIAFRRSSDSRIRAVSYDFGEREISTAGALPPSPSGDWANYLKAATLAVRDQWQTDSGMNTAITSDLPPAAGLSSSSALLVAATLALLQVNEEKADFQALMAVLPEAEHFVGTRGGGMDHAAVLAAESGCALLVHFAPLAVSSVPIPENWSFLLANSLIKAEKSGGVREAYNSCRNAGVRAREKLGFSSYAEALASHSQEDLQQLASGNQLSEEEARCFLHVTGEAWRVEQAVQALRVEDAHSFGNLLSQSHKSLRDLLQVSCPELDELVEIAMNSGAGGARLTGAGFGGCALIFCQASQVDRIRQEVIRKYYQKRHDAQPNDHIFPVLPSAGVLNA